MDFVALARLLLEQGETFGEKVLNNGVLVVRECELDRLELIELGRVLLV